MTWLTIGEILRLNAHKYPEKLAFKDMRRKITFKELEERTNRFAHALLKLGATKGDRIGVLLYNSIEFIEIYISCAKTGLIIVPISFRLVSTEILEIIRYAKIKGIIAAQDFLEEMTAVREKNKRGDPDFHILTGEGIQNDYLSYEHLINEASNQPISIDIHEEDPWVLLFTSGTTGKPKGVVRSHRSYIAFFTLNAIEFGFTKDDYGLIVMPLSHVNSTFFSFIFTYLGAPVYVQRETKFNPEELLKIIEKEKITFTSLIPTHYALILKYMETTHKKYDTSSIRAFLCSSAPVRKEIKEKILATFPNVNLFEAYGSTEAGTVTVLHPEEQFTKVGSIGRELIGSRQIRLLDDNKKEVEVRKVGEIFSKSPQIFEEYWNDPKKTKQVFFEEYFSAGDMGWKDEDGYYYIECRKDDMIITGGEHVYPVEVEKVISEHTAVEEVAVIGVPHEKWGEAVQAVIVLKAGYEPTEEEIIDYCRGKMAVFKKPKLVKFITISEMPHTSTGKIQRRVLKDKYPKLIPIVWKYEDWLKELK